VNNAPIVVILFLSDTNPRMSLERIA